MPQILSSSLAILLLSGCGQTGAPLPPSLQLPEPVSDLAAKRVGNRVDLNWTMPRRTTDKLLLKGPQPVHICRRIADGPCAAVADLTFPPEKPATYQDSLPAELTTGTAQLLLYSVELASRHGRTAGASNLAYTASGPQPLPFTGLQGQIQSNGVVLRWQPVPPSGVANRVSIQRTLLATAPKSENKSTSPLGGTAEPLVKVQTLSVRLPPGADPGQALDPDAAFDQRYSYTLARLMTVSVGGKSIDLEGLPSPEIVVDTKDSFPPNPPAGLVAVAAPDEGAIDLSWAPNTEKDLAGYAVYRRESSAEPNQISDHSKPLDSPAFRDQTAKPGHEYTYSVTAIDRDGNQSSRSPEASETLPAKP